MQFGPDVVGKERLTVLGTEDEVNQKLG